MENPLEKLPAGDQVSEEKPDTEQPPIGKKRIRVGHTHEWIGGQKKEVSVYEWVDEKDVPDKLGDYWQKSQRPGMHESKPVSREEFYRKQGMVSPSVERAEEKDKTAETNAPDA